jgi:Secretion system C-terminal sorting domain
MNKYGLFIIAACTLSFISDAQVALVTAGGDVSNSSGSVSYSIGQVSYSHVESASGSIHEGVQQPYELFAVTVAESLSDINVTIYPNPVVSQLSVRMTSFREGILLSFYTLQGALVHEVPLQSNQQFVDVSVWAAASYVMRITSESGEVSEYTLIKN